MTKSIPLLVLATSLIVGCGDIDTLDTWEYQTEVPHTTTPAELIEIENNLRSNGYVRVVIRDRLSDNWNQTLMGKLIFATRKPLPAPLPPTTPSQCR